MATRIQQRVIAFRKMRGISQERLAELSGLNKNTITKIEKGGDCTISTIDKIESALGIPLY